VGGALLITRHHEVSLSWGGVAEGVSRHTRAQAVQGWLTTVVITTINAVPRGALQGAGEAGRVSGGQLVPFFVAYVTPPLLFASLKLLGLPV
jgi:hypothetical protein